jgi:hypothetical protein
LSTTQTLTILLQAASILHAYIISIMPTLLPDCPAAQTLAKTRTFLQQLSAPPDFVPANLEALSSATPAAATAAAAPAAAEQQQQQQQDGADTK